jgi:cell division protein WhiA
MSFSIDVKNEMVRLKSTKTEYIAELSAFIRNNAYIDDELIRIHTENASIARRIFKIIKDLYQVSCKITVRKNFNFKRKLIYIVEVKMNHNVILKDLAIKNEQGYFINVPRDYIISDDEEKRAYLRGCFLACGSINNPKTSRYHLEFLIDDYDYAEFLNDVMNEYDLNSRIIKRTKGYMVYIKEAEKISDFLRMIKAYNAVMYFEDVRIYRDHKNMTNRLNNCEQANVEKAINTAVKHLDDINLIKSEIGLDMLDDKLKEVALFRLENPEASLLELSDIISEKNSKVMTKSCLNHRFRKIKNIANSIRGKDCQ